MARTRRSGGDNQPRKAAGVDRDGQPVHYPSTHTGLGKAGKVAINRPGDGGAKRPRRGPTSTHGLALQQKFGTAGTSRGGQRRGAAELAAERAAAPKGGGVRRPINRAKSGAKALREIKFFQKSTELLIRKLPFARLCRELAVDLK